MEKPAHRSVSQLTSWLSCGEAYRLQRIEKAPQLQAAWFAQGLAIHAAVEAYELSGRRLTLAEALDVAREQWAAETAKMYAADPNLDNWLRGGKKSTEDDLTQRFQKVYEHVEGYIRWCETNRDHEWLYVFPDGKPGVEVPFEIIVNGVPVKGAIDLIIETSNGIKLRDVKTGTKIPPSPIQLAVYRWAVKELTGQLPYEADYFMTKDFRPSKPVNVSHYTREMVETWFRNFETGVQNEVYVPNPGQCFPCTVKNACSFVY
ncbi:PD-(D/E)XK nuclease family protein (plasmid) [Streptomyces sp. BI20]|uniref:PD-(D/E)XK nuclease family protein n=1 Tax=Streptomyces sp. BI20 TaxID=3403460 RepID=UPI003C74789E